MLPKDTNIARRQCPCRLVPGCIVKSVGMFHKIDAGTGVAWCPLSIEQKGLVFYNSCTAVTTPGQHGTNPCHG